MHKGPRGTEAVESGHVVAIQDVRGLDKKQNGKGWSDEGVSYTVDTHATQGVATCEIDTVGTLRAHHPGTAGTQSDTDHIVATYPINTQLGLRGPDVSNTGRDGLGLGNEDDPAYTLQAGHGHAVAYDHPGRFNNIHGGSGEHRDVMPTLEATNPKQIVAYDAAHAFKVRGGCEGGGKGYLGSDEVAFTLSTNQDQHIFSEPAIAWSEELTASVDVAGTIQRGGSGGRHDGVMVPTEIYQDSEFGVQAYDQAGTLRAGRIPAHQMTLQQSTVRRLTPVECERLQGFPDNFTAIPWRKKGAEDCPDGPRYKALGNSMAVPVMRWIGERINTIDDLISVL
jgi:DNA (cytosine-5)-methyltransferase 1